MQPANRDQWHRAIGKLMFSFGFIELHVNQLLGFWLDEEVYKHIASDPLSKRIRLAIGITPAHSNDQAFVDELIDLLERITKLAEQRNIVAHNPVLLRSKRLSSGKWDIKSAIKHPKRPEKFLGLNDLEAVAEDAAMASEELVRLLMSAIQQIMEGRHGKAGMPRLETIAKMFGAEPLGLARTP